MYVNNSVLLESGCSEEEILEGEVFFSERELSFSKIRCLEPSVAMVDSPD